MKIRHITTPDHIILCQSERRAPLWRWTSTATIYFRPSNEQACPTRSFGCDFREAGEALDFAEECARDVIGEWVDACDEPGIEEAPRMDDQPTLNRWPLPDSLRSLQRTDIDRGEWSMVKVPVVNHDQHDPCLI